MLDTKKLYDEMTTGIWRWPLVRQVAVALMKNLLHEKEINQVLRESGHLPTKAFIETVFDYLGVQYQLNLCSNADLPLSGRCVVVANHPLGGLDGLMLLHALLSVRNDVKIVANQLLAQIKPIADNIIPVNSLAKDYSRNHIKQIKRCLEAEKAVIFFPAAEVSRKYKSEIEDREWSKGAYALARACDAPIVPVYVEGENSALFYRISQIAPIFSTFLLPREMWQQHKKAIQLHIGCALPMTMLRGLPVDDRQVMQLLKNHVYQLKEPEQGVFNPAQPLAQALAPEVIRSAVEQTTLLGKINEQTKVLLYQAQHNAALLQEIGRLREYSFRKVGEGSGCARDLDSFDAYYHHLLIWHECEQAVMGAYRVLPTKRVVAQKGVSALYTHGMFEFKGNIDWLNEAMELGRGFIYPDYWNSKALDLMWQGIGAYVARLDNMRYLFGSVSISANYPREAVDWLVAFYRYYMPAKSKVVVARNPYIITKSKQRWFDEYFAELTVQQAQKELKKRLRSMGLAIPTLFKHYSALCEQGGVKFTDFGIDPEFGFTVDGFVIVDLTKIKAKKHQRYVAPFIKQPKAISQENIHQTDTQTA